MTTDQIPNKLLPYEGNQPYLFISYAHMDRSRVEKIIRGIAKRGFRIWYDKGNHTGKDWHKNIFTHLEKSRCFINFFTAATEYRDVVLEEIQFALKKRKADPTYKIFFVMLEKVASSNLPQDIQQEINDIQYLDARKCNGITEEFFRELFRIDWPEDLIDIAYCQQHGLTPWTPAEKNALIPPHFMTELFQDDLYIYPQAEYTSKTVPEENGKTWSFHKISPDQMDKQSVYHTCLDDQWLPQALAQEEDIQIQGYRTPSAQKRILSFQKKEIFRGLLHNWQLVVNRASMYNCSIFHDWYAPGTNERPAFQQLLKNGSIALFLMEEAHPAEKPRYETLPGYFEDWSLLCRETPVFCLRFDWENEDSNRYENAKLLSYPFQNFCLTLVDDAFRLGELEEIFAIPQEKRQDFRQCWRAVQEDVLTWVKAQETRKQNPYNRTRFYQKFLSQPGTEISQGQLRQGTFIWELKQAIDHQYTTALPAALNIRPLIPTDNKIQTLGAMDSYLHSTRREIAIDELLYTIVEFAPTFLTPTMLSVKRECLSLSDVQELRDTTEWNAYLRAVSNGKSHSSLDDLNLSDIKMPWECYQKLLTCAESKLKKDVLHLTESTGCLTLRFDLGGYALDATYRYGAEKIQIKAPQEEPPPTLERKSILTISYLCGEIDDLKQENSMLTMLHLFEGLTHQSGKETLNKLKKKLEGITLSWTSSLTTKTILR